MLEQLEEKEKLRRSQTLNLIASENYASPEIRQALTSVFGDKYAEGAPGRRFYSGCEVADELENYTVELAKKVFGAEYVNVQPHSGSTANQIVYASQLEPGDTVLAMSMDAGGHLTHGSKVSLTAKIYNFVHYGLCPDTQTIDYDQIEALAKEHKPKLIIAGASAYPREIDFERVGKICKENSAIFMADIAHIAGMIAAGLHQHPLPHADIVTMTTQKTLRGPRGGMILAKAEHEKAIQRAVMPGVQGGPHLNSIKAKALMLENALKPGFNEYQKMIIDNAKAMANTFLEGGVKLVSGGTDNHLLILDVYEGGQSEHSMTGKEAEGVLAEIGIASNRNMIPGDTLGPFKTSGLRLGTPAMTTRGMTPDSAQQIADIIIQALRAKGSPDALSELAGKVKSLATSMPPPG